MKKKILILLSILSLFLLVACDASQDEYDSILSENEKLKSENASLSNQIEKLESEKSELTQSVMDFASETTQAQKEDIDLEYNNKYVKLITEQIYGENCNFTIADSALYINAFYTQEYSYELYKKMLDDYTTFGSLYIYTMSDVPDGLLKFNFISICCYDKDSNGVVSISYTQNDDIIQIKDILINYEYVYDIAQNAGN